VGAVVAGATGANSKLAVTSALPETLELKLTVQVDAVPQLADVLSKLETVHDTN